MSDFEKLAELAVEVDSYRLEQAEAPVSSDFRRVTTTIVLTGRGHEGHGEDVTYEPDDHEDFPQLELAGAWTPRSLSEALEGWDLFPAKEPSFPASHDYRRWAIESAALDLALRQAGSRGSSAGGFRRAGLARCELRWIVLRWARIAQAGPGPRRPPAALVPAAAGSEAFG